MKINFTKALIKGSGVSIEEKAHDYKQFLLQKLILNQTIQITQQNMFKTISTITLLIQPIKNFNASD